MPVCDGRGSRSEMEVLRLEVDAGVEEEDGAAGAKIGAKPRPAELFGVVDGGAGGAQFLSRCLQEAHGRLSA